ncbi:MAG: hypothetical protein QXM96_02825, partial [Candidatus Woesearchaeota archaeon]
MKKIFSSIIENKILPSYEILEQKNNTKNTLEEIFSENLKDFFNFLNENKIYILTKEHVFSFIEKIKKENENKKNIDKQETDNNIKKSNKNCDIEIIENYYETNAKLSVNDFVNLYNKRFFLLQNILKQRKELENAVSIKRISFLDDKEQVSFIGIVSEISYTKNNNLILVLEDNTDKIKAIITKNKEKDTNFKEIILDEVIGITGTKSGDIVFVNSVFFPDVPITTELKKTNIKESAVFISDIHIGSKAFLKKEFELFIDWLCGKTENK